MQIESIQPCSDRKIEFIKMMKKKHDESTLCAVHTPLSE